MCHQPTVVLTIRKSCLLLPVSLYLICLQRRCPYFISQPPCHVPKHCLIAPKTGSAYKLLTYQPLLCLCIGRFHLLCGSPPVFSKARSKSGFSVHRSSTQVHREMLFFFHLSFFSVSYLHNRKKYLQEAVLTVSKCHIWQQEENICMPQSVLLIPQKICRQKWLEAIFFILFEEGFKKHKGQEDAVNIFLNMGIWRQVSEYKKKKKL